MYAIPFTGDLVAAKVAKFWPEPLEHAEAMRVLATVPSADLDPEGVWRVQLAVLKLSAGNLRELKDAVLAANRDWRDVLMWAEYPIQSRLPLRADASEATTQDKSNYEAWLRIDT